jgi:hypothetical protein
MGRGGSVGFRRWTVVITLVAMELCYAYSGSSASGCSDQALGLQGAKRHSIASTIFTQCGIFWNQLTPPA